MFSYPWMRVNPCGFSIAPTMAWAWGVLTLYVSMICCIVFCDGLCGISFVGFRMVSQSSKYRIAIRAAYSRWMGVRLKKNRRNKKVKW